MEPAGQGIRVMMRFVPRVLPALGLVLGGLACNALQAGGVLEPSASGGGQTPQEIADATTELLDRWGDRHAFYAAMASLDAGYLGGQVIDNSAELAADGTIAGVEPAGPPLGLLRPTGPNGEGPPGEAGLGAAAQIVPAGWRQADTPADQYVEDVGSWLSELWDAGQDAIKEPAPIEADDQAAARLEDSVALLTLELAGRGYSGDQIIEAILTNSVSDDGGLFGCLYIQGPDGAPVHPASSPIDAVGVSCPSLEGKSDRLEIRRAEAFDGFCHDTIVKLQGGGTYQICVYQISWELAYRRVEVPAEASCAAEGSGRLKPYLRGGFFGGLPSERLHEPRGTWSHTFEERGRYSAPGVYQDRILCQVHAGANGEGPVLASAQADITVDISEVRAID